MSPGPASFHMQQASQHAVPAQQNRGRSSSPGAPTLYHSYSLNQQQAVQHHSGGLGGYPGGASTGPRSSQASAPSSHHGSRGASREPSPMNRNDNSISLFAEECIRPEEIIYGRQLGAGGSGAVFQGHWRGQECAIKKISGFAHFEEIKKEIKALRGLKHPRLVRFIGACIQPPTLLVVTEFMCGGSLHDRLFGNRREPLLAPMQRWVIACHCCEGLAFLHASRVVHRDLKSMNVLLDSGHNAKLCDFGLAQQMESTHLARRTEGEGGSPRYMAPECYETGYGKLTEKVDVWALGCIFIEIFTNSLPYADCVTMQQLSKRILVDKRPPEVPRTVPGPLIAPVQRCFSFQAAMRPSAADMQAELAKVRPR
eukprot:gnl/TRDRNA2_/TRDRNA2_140088_c0_seq1.p1 gnl/TRDRNA2_/TRDRNA2_140088_c0~~gnl/TRDRNA2_/TRDRNA2_140088_c0_seq1.p1  ORF type:complete len:381 (+),score=65.07 gnl/TRDRNA2_/TRDRNA2_140088_c0_seq1:39-1145(+)